MDGDLRIQNADRTVRNQGIETATLSRVELALGAARYRARVACTIDELTVADEPSAWAGLGFAVEGDVCVVGDVRIRLAGAAAAASGSRPSGGLERWSLRGVESTELDGLPTRLSDLEPPSEAPAHPNGVVALDHVVAITPALERTVAALQAAGLDLRRIREEPTPAGAPRQAFFRLGPNILEVVQAPPEAIERSGGSDGPAFFWGLAFAAPDLDATVAALGDAVGAARAAVQPGRRIATLRRSAGLSLPVALITPVPAA